MADLRDLVRVPRADVYKGDRLAARLERTPEGVRFAYLPDYDGPPVATSLPLDTAPFLSPAGAVPPFFAGLLPEGRRLTALRHAVKTSADDELSLLLAIGRDTIGDVRIVPGGRPPEPPEPRVSTDDLENLRFSDLVDFDLEPIDPVGLPGVQDKVSARMLAMPLQARAGSYILKLEPPEFPGLVRNEAFFLRAARRSGLDVAEAKLVQDATGHWGLLLARFDRPTFPDGTTAIRAQEDGCQVLRRYPADKYALTAEEVVGGLAAWCQAKPVATRALFQQVAFAYLTGNGDQHAKNLSILRVDGEWRASPAYDLPSSHPYGDTTMALTIDGRTREDITRRSFLALARSVGLAERAAARALDHLVNRVDAWLGDLDQLPFDRRRIHRLRRLVLDRAKKLGGG